MDKDITSQESAAAPEEAEAAPKRAPRTRRKATTTSDAAAPAATETASVDADAETAPAEPAAKAPVKRATRSRAKKVAEPAVEAAATEASAETAAVVEADAAGIPATEIPAAKAPVKRAPRRRATSAVTSPAATVDAAAEAAPVEAVVEAPAAEAVVEAEAPAKAPAKRATRSRTRKPAAETAVEGAAEEAAEPAVVETVEAVEAPAEEAAPAKTTRTAAKAPARSRARRTTAEQRAAVIAEAVQAAEAAAQDEALEAEGEATAEAPAAAAPVVEAVAENAVPVQDALFLSPSLLFQAPDLSLAVAIPAVPTVDEVDEDEEGEEAGDGNRRRRSRSRKGRARTGAEEGEAGTETEGEDTEEAAAADDGVTSRRRRRRRRGDADLELTGGTDEDPPNTITKVRAPRQPSEAPVSNRVTSLRGSTRLEAKKQRRRESRDSGRRRQVITEAEFLARRESVDRTMVVRQSDDRIQIGVLEDGILAEHFVSKTMQDSLIGNVYLGKVQNVLPSMEAAFVDIGRGRNAVLYAGEVNWDAAQLNGQPRRIENALKSGDAVLVQVTKDPVGHKGARLTSQISLPGRYLVYVPGGSMTGISRKLPDVERNRLKRILKDHLPQDAGVIVRTAAEGASEEELTHDINRLRAQWEGIQTQTNSTKTLAPEMLYGEPDLTIKVVRDVFNEDFTKLIVSGDDAWDTIEAYVTYVAPDLVDRLEKWTKTEDIFAAHRIDEQINKALERKVFLPSGGSLVIDRTEAMTVVDVNTGKFTGSGGNLEETVTKNNLEAAEEVVRQLRLRDIGGIIVIDFIDMVLESNRDLVLRRLVECLGRDRTKHQVAEVTSLGLVQMTRKRMGTGLLEVFGEQCETCAGRGMVTHEVPVEHRRAHTIAAEAHHPAPRGDHARSDNRSDNRADSRPEGRGDGRSTAGRDEQRSDGRGEAGRGSRNERKRSRSRQQSPAEVEAAPAPVHHEELSDEAKASKASAARAALAAVAAATAASHHDDHVHAEPAHAPAPASVPVLTFGDEAVELPRGDGHGAETVADKAATLADLAQALDQLSGAEPAEDEREGAPQRSSRSRRGRRNRSASRAQGAANENEVTQHEGHEGADAASEAAPAHVAKVEPAAAPVKTVPANEPIILGVGVPASEL
ncbi:Rne/Rng family ribonuclease [Arthrobacter sp. 35W]|uniref:Rne/Rng family ribonuclease n=1 Tax=Arthrobacter sp. 35W TaxID=1132441 RepID=UPI0003FF2063|nr:Rne/Rng family ribonuclease [Arthrobacter sp. 35W]